MSNSKDFNGKVVLVTGSSSGIGEGTAIIFSKLGANVVITGRNGDNVKRVARECQSVSPKGLKVSNFFNVVIKIFCSHQLLDIDFHKL